MVEAVLVSIAANVMRGTLLPLGGTLLPLLALLPLHCWDRNSLPYTRTYVHTLAEVELVDPRHYTLHPGAVGIVRFEPAQHVCTRLGHYHRLRD